MKNEKRRTRAVRVSEDWHWLLKIEAAREKITIARLVDEMCSHYFACRIPPDKTQ
jgi:predicted DNA-binding ribbon-helix-helix protein